MHLGDQANEQNGHEPLPCMHCGIDLLESGLGVVILIRPRGHEPYRYSHGYWACKGACDKALESTFDATQYSTGWQELEKLTNPLIYKAWHGRSERLIAAERFSPPAAATVRRLTDNLAWVGSKVPTAHDAVEFRLWRMIMDEF